jgi:biopolymer transport protein ExbD
MEQLIERLKAVKSAETDPRVFINGDQKAELGKAIAVLDEVRKLGISKVAIETKAK